MDKIFMILAGLFTALCWLSLCFDYDVLMYCFGIMAIIILWLADSSKTTKQKIDSIQQKDRGEEE